jgi:aryl-alcohol dehydrogenase-like predicted oxidoreductase
MPNHSECFGARLHSVSIFIDTADSYGPYVSEELMHEALYPYPTDLVLATKAGLVRTGPEEWAPVGRPAYLRQELEMSLRRLHVEQIDLFQLHRVDSLVPFDAHIGLSEATIEQILAAQLVATIASVQNHYNLADRGSEAVLNFCSDVGLGFIPRSPVGGGDLHRSNGTLARVARECGATTGQVALAWLLRRSPNMLPIPGTSVVSHLEENVAAAVVQLTDAQYAALLTTP